MMTRTTMEVMAKGFLRSRRIPSWKKVLDSPMTSCCFFASSEAFSKSLALNFERSIWEESNCRFL